MRCIGVILSALGLVLAMAGSAQAQLGYDRHGEDYSNFAVRSGDPAICASRCEHDGRCRAWSFSYPHTKNASAICRLMKGVPSPTEDACCMTGVCGAGAVLPQGEAVEYGIDRSGGDYKSFTTRPDPAGAACRSACDADHRCRAWSYVRPGYGSASARCYLKSRVTRPRHKPCCISGVVR
jgi:hypothetical protein